MITGNCKLCTVEKELCLSHIIPHFIFKYIKDCSGRYTFVNPESSSMVFGQKEYTEYLLCEECEGKIKVYEEYVKDFLFEPETRGVKMTKTSSHRYFVGLDYRKIKLFQLSILWRASISQQRFFSQVRLKSYRNELLRKMIYNGDPGKPTFYGCQMTSLHDDTGKEIDVCEILTNPRFQRRQPFFEEEEKQIYHFVFGGYSWGFYISEKIISKVKKYFVTEEGKMCAPILSISEHPLLKEPLLHDVKVEAEPKGALRKRLKHIAPTEGQQNSDIR